MKICTKCGFDYPAPLEDHFSKKRTTKDGFQERCKKCDSEHHKQHYKKRTNYYKEKANRHKIEYRQRNLQFIVEYFKTHPCVDCGESDFVVLEFDHVKGQKLNNVSNMIGTGAPLDDLKQEIEKCEVRCANCHRRKTAKQFGWYKRLGDQNDSEGSPL
jgi:hypothetical protein